jgi:hypothetical protein
MVFTLFWRVLGGAGVGAETSERAGQRKGRASTWAAGSDGNRNHSLCTAIHSLTPPCRNVRIFLSFLRHIVSVLEHGSDLPASLGARRTLPTPAPPSPSPPPLVLPFLISSLKYNILFCFQGDYKRTGRVPRQLSSSAPSSPLPPVALFSPLFPPQISFLPLFLIPIRYVSRMHCVLPVAACF